MPPLIGLTGAIAAGKSAVLQALADLGAETLSTDAVTHELLAGDAVRDLLIAHWGEEVAPEGKLDRGRIGAIVFESPEELSWLEGILHPMVGARVASWREELDPRAPLGVVEVPLLFEGTMAAAFDATLVVAAEDETRADRAGERGTEALAAREARQLSQDEKIARADFVVRNDGDRDELDAAVAELWPLLLEAGGKQES
jgi:dephospho-CoA kinase